VRTFILFIRRFFNLILFLALEIASIVLISNTQTLQGTDIVSSANTVSGLLYKKQSDVIYYFGLRKMNDSLLSENLRLRALLSSRYEYDTLKDIVIKREKDKVDSVHTIKYAEYIYRTARVVNNSVSFANNYITINRGYADGIGKNMAVVSGTGIVGRIVHVSAHFASALSVLSVKQQVSARLKDGTIGYIAWDGERPDVMVMKDVPQQIKVKPGDSVYTTSVSFFPPDIMIGTVLRVETVKKNNLQLLYLKPATNFRQLQYVYVVENKMFDERKHLEDSLKTKP
jgi:rod shape-determining protein MreC